MSFNKCYTENWGPWLQHYSLSGRYSFTVGNESREKKIKQQQKQYETGFLKNLLSDFSMSLLPHKQFTFKIYCDSHNNSRCFMSLRQSVIPCSNIYWIRGFCLYTQFWILKDVFIYRRDSFPIRVTQMSPCWRIKRLDDVSRSLFRPKAVCGQKGFHSERKTMGII